MTDPRVYVLTYEYSDRSGFRVCGVTRNVTVAKAWYEANDETNVYVVNDRSEPVNWTQGLQGWRQAERTAAKAEKGLKKKLDDGAVA